MSAPIPLTLSLARVIGYTRLWPADYLAACEVVQHQGRGWALLAIVDGAAVYACRDAATFQALTLHRQCWWYAVPPQVLAEGGS
jgi:hypothetical protein